MDDYISSDWLDVATRRNNDFYCSVLFIYYYFLNLFINDYDFLNVILKKNIQ